MVDILSPDLTEKEKTTMPLILTKPTQPYDAVPATSSQNPQNGTLNNVNNGDLAGISEESATIVKPDQLPGSGACLRENLKKFCSGN